MTITQAEHHPLRLSIRKPEIGYQLQIEKPSHVLPGEAFFDTVTLSQTNIAIINELATGRQRNGFTLINDSVSTDRMPDERFVIKDQKGKDQAFRMVCLFLGELAFAPRTRFSLACSKSKI